MILLCEIQVNNKIHNNKLDERTVKVDEDYKEYYVLERAFAARRQGDMIVPASRKINRDELIRDFFYQNTLRFGIKKANAFFLSLYYQQYGKNNDLGLEYHTGYITFRNNGNRYTVEVRPEAERHLDLKVQEEEEQERQKQQKEEEYASGISKPKVSAIEKFNRRMARYNEKYAKKTGEDELIGSQPGDE